MLTASRSASACICPDGMGKDVVGVCIGCTLYEYLNNTTGICMQCPVNSVAIHGATDRSQCFCQPGFQHSGSVCSLCPTGTYYVSDSVACKACPKGSTTAGQGATSRRSCGASQALCSPGYVFIAFVGCSLQQVVVL